MAIPGSDTANSAGAGTATTATAIRRNPTMRDRYLFSIIAHFDLHLIHGFEGFLVIESTHSLDVVAVYTAGTKEGVTSMDVERVFERYLT